MPSILRKPDGGAESGAGSEPVESPAWQLVVLPGPRWGASSRMDGWWSVSAGGTAFSSRSLDTALRRALRRPGPRRRRR